MGACGRTWERCDGAWPAEPQTLPEAYEALRSAVDRLEHQMVSLPADSKILKRLDKSVFLMKIAIKIAKRAIKADKREGEFRLLEPVLEHTDFTDERVLGRFTSSELEAELTDRRESMRQAALVRIRNGVHQS